MRRRPWCFGVHALAGVSQHCAEVRAQRRSASRAVDAEAQELLRQVVATGPGFCANKTRRLMAPRLPCERAVTLPTAKPFTLERETLAAKCQLCKAPRFVALLRP